MDEYQDAAKEQYVAYNRKLERKIHKYFPFLYKGFKPNWIEIRQVALTLRRLPAAFDGYRILHIGDIHIGTWMTPERLAGIVKLVNGQGPALIVNTGDILAMIPIHGK